MRTTILLGLLLAVMSGSTSASAQSVFTVDRLTDTGEGEGLAGDLRYCITNATSGEDVIVFGVRGAVVLRRSLPDLNVSVSILGPGANLLDLSCAGSRAFNVGSASTVQISGLVMTNCRAFIGGAIYNRGTLTINDSKLSENGGFNGEGGAIYNEGRLTINNSILSYNGGSLIQVLYGGGIYNAGNLTINNSTLSGNSVDDAEYLTANGGAIANYGTLSINNSTLTDNNTLYGGGIYNAGTLNLRNTVLAGNTAYLGRDLDGSLATSGYNLIGSTEGGSGYDETDLLNVNPMLGPLRDNGGPTFTHALLPGSPAIDAGDPNFSGLPDFDQRGDGFPRIVNGIVDIGAFEVQASIPGNQRP
jgi:hypothetical protein